MNLYKVSCKLGVWYVIADSFNSAAGTLTKALNDNNYGDFMSRRIDSVDLVAPESGINGKFGSEQLIIQEK